MTRCLMTACFAVLVVSAALAQEKTVPPPPNPSDEGPSLEVTLKFIQEKLKDKLPYWTEISVDPADCKLTLTKHILQTVTDAPTVLRTPFHFVRWRKLRSPALFSAFLQKERRCMSTKRLFTSAVSHSSETSRVESFRFRHCRMKIWPTAWLRPWYMRLNCAAVAASRNPFSRREERV